MKYLKKINKKKSIQLSQLFSAEISSLVIGYLLLSILSKKLLPEGLGYYSLFQTILTTTFLFLKFGIYNTSSLLILNTTSQQEKKELIGSLYIICAFIGVILSFTFFIGSFLIEKTFINSTIGLFFRNISFLFIIFPLSETIAHICRATNQINILSFYKITYKALLLTMIVCYSLLKSTFIPEIICLMFLFSIYSLTIVVSMKFKPSFNNSKKHIKNIFKKNKSYGIHLYLGQIIDESTFYLDKILIGIYLSFESIGYYHIGVAITAPIILFSNTLSTILFKDFAHQNKLSNKVIILNIFTLILSGLILIIFKKWIIILLFGLEYLKTLPIITPLIIGLFFNGLAQPYAIFLKAKGFGKVGYFCLFSGPVNLIGNIILIPKFGILGAAYATLISNITIYIFYFTCYIYYLNIKDFNSETSNS